MEILPTYLETIFITEPPAEGWPRDFIIITACNPYSSGDRHGDAEAMTRLQRALEQCGGWIHPLDCSSPDGREREASFAVAGLPLSDALALGADFKQNAIFAIERGVIWVLGCTDQSRQIVGIWAERLYRESDLRET